MAHNVRCKAKIMKEKQREQKRTGYVMANVLGSMHTQR